MIGHEQSEQLDVEPAKYFVVVTKREKRACKSCEERGVLAAPLPPRIVEKSLVSDRVVIDAVVSKYADHCPLYRQSAMLERDSGVELSRQTLDGWVMRVGELLVPLVEALRHELLGGSYLQADETPVGVQMHDGRGSNHLAYLWQYGRPHGAVVFEFRMGRGREGPKRFLEKFDGLLQSDGYAVYDSVGGPKMVHAACWSHARRKFIEAVKLHPGDAAAVRLVAHIDALFAIDAEARLAKLDHAARHALRSTKAPALLDRDQGRTDRGARYRIARQRPGQSLELHAGALAETHALPAIPGTGAEQQPRRKLHAPCGPRSQKLDPHRQPASRTQSRRHPLHRRNLPPHQHPRARLLGRCPPRPRQHVHPPPRPTHAYRLGPAQPLTSTHAHPVNHVVALTLAINRLLPAHVASRFGGPDST